VTGAALLLAAAVAGNPPAPVAFPGASAAPDPTGRYTVELADGAGGRRELRLKVLASGASRSLLALPRSATAYWSPDGNALALAVRRDADHGTVLLFFPDRPGETDLAAELSRALGPLPEQTENRRVFLEVVRWRDAKRLRLRLRGFGTRDPGGFDELFDYELGGKFKRPAF
jgi:hypothetical protein